MLESMSDAATVIAYVRLLDEEVEVLRPTRLQHLGGGVYEMLENAPYGETWEFEAPARVLAETRHIVAGQRLVITSLAPTKP